MTKRKFVKVTSHFAGFHQWPEAPECVKFLRNLHRHKFGVKVTVEVTHADRDVEFFICQAELGVVIGERLLPALNKNPSLSCEMMAEILGEAMIGLKYSVREVEVDEDGENSGVVQWEGNSIDPEVIKEAVLGVVRKHKQPGGLLNEN